MAVDQDPSSATSSLYARARLHIPSDYTRLPTKWLDSYASFVRANASQVSQLESGLRSLTYIIPGRFHDTPLQTETLYTTINLLTAYHTHLLAPTTASPQSRYDRSCTSNRIYARCAALLRTLQYTQLLCEMFAKRSGEKVRWRVVVLLEIVKAVCRFAMSRVTGRGVVGTQIGAENQERRAEEVEDANSGDGGVVVNGRGNEEWKMPRTGMKLPTLPSPELGESVTEFLGKRVITADDIKSAQRLVHKLQTVQGQLAEVMWIVRPVVYALLLQRFQANKRDWRPWIAGLGMEVLSRQLEKKDVGENVIGGIRGLSVVEREEMKRRGGSMAWWGMRGAFYENVTRGWIQGVAGRLKGKMLLDMVGTVVEDYDYLWDEYYFSTATV